MRSVSFKQRRVVIQNKSRLTKISVKVIGTLADIGSSYTTTDTTTKTDISSVVSNLALKALVAAKVKSGSSILIKEHDNQFIDDVIKSELNRRGYVVKGYAETNLLLELELKKDLVGCDDTTCFTEIGGALGVDYIMTYSVF